MNSTIFRSNVFFKNTLVKELRASVKMALRRNLPVQRPVFYSGSSLTLQHHVLFRNESKNLIHFGKSGGRRNIHTEPLNPKQSQVSPRLVAFFLLAGTALTTFDLYYYFYLYEKPPVPLSQDEFRKFKLQEIIPLTADTSLFRFATNMPAADAPVKSLAQTTGAIPIPSHVIVKDDSCQIARPYTPSAYARRHFDLIVKRYENGSVSRFLHGKEVGDMVEIRGPIPTLMYRPNMVQTLGMICGGTGITPMYQLLARILRDPSDQTSIKLVYASKSPGDILLRQELDELAAKHPGRLSILYTVDSATSEEWNGEVGWVQPRMLSSFFPAPDANASTPSSFLTLVCGSDGFVTHVAGAKGSGVGASSQGKLGGILKQLRYDEGQVYKL